MTFGERQAPLQFGLARRSVDHPQLVPSGTVPQTRIDDAVRRILVVKCEMGLLDGTPAPGRPAR